MGTNPLEGLILQQHLKDAQEHSAKVKQIMREEAEAHRQSWEALNNSLALFSSGTIALSITYLGYLQSAGIKVTHPLVAVRELGLSACEHSDGPLRAVHPHVLRHLRTGERVQRVGKAPEGSRSRDAAKCKCGGYGKQRETCYVSELKSLSDRIWQRGETGRKVF